MVNECRAIDSTFRCIAENKVDVLLFQLGNEIILASGYDHCVRDNSFRWSNINLTLCPLETIINGCTAGELAEAGSLERLRDGFAVIIKSEIHQSVIFPAVDPAVCLLTPYII